MGTNSIGQAVNGNVIPQEDHNSLRNALIGDYVPRNSSAIAESEAGDLGTSTYPWKRANISVGYLFAGMIVPFYDYNGTLSIPHGWMICDGRVINEANYNTEHGAGAWDEYIISSPIDGKYLPNLHTTNEVYIAGTSAKTTQAGSSPLTLNGNASNQKNLQHSHSGAPHRHVWYNAASSGSDDQTYNSSGNPTALTSGTLKTSGDKHIEYSTAATFNIGTSYTSSENIGTTNNSLGTTEDITPQTLRALMYMRII